MKNYSEQIHKFYRNLSKFVILILLKIWDTKKSVIWSLILRMRNSFKPNGGYKNPQDDIHGRAVIQSTLKNNNNIKKEAVQNTKVIIFDVIKNSAKLQKIETQS